MKKVDLSVIEKSIGYTFKDKSLLQMAMTHRSVGKNNNERLEYLGDSFLNFAIANWLFQRPSLSEGQLSRARAYLVSKKQLAQYAKSLNLLDFLVTRNTKIIKGSSKSEALIADCFEALWGAVVHEAGMVKAQQVFFSLYEKTLMQAVEKATVKDPKTKLQEICQSRYQKLPDYTLIKQQGRGHLLEFFVKCQVSDYEFFGQGQSIKLAQYEAAQQMLKVLGE